MVIEREHSQLHAKALHCCLWTCGHFLLTGLKYKGKKDAKTESKMKHRTKDQWKEG
jgi:hypothetical protein